MDTISTKDAEKLINDNPDMNLDTKAGSKNEFSAWNAARDRSVYETDNIQNPDLKRYIDSMREYIARNDYENHTTKSAKAASFGAKPSGYWGAEANIPEIHKEAEEYKKQAKEILGKLDLESLSPNDYKAYVNVQVNSNNLGNNVQESAERAATIQTVVQKLPPESISRLIVNMPLKVQDNFIKEANEAYPQVMPTKEDMNTYASEMVQNIVDRKPRPDFTDVKNIKLCLSDEATNVYRNRTAAMSAERDAEMNKETATTKHQLNTSRFDINPTSYSASNKESTGPNFG